MDERLRSLGLSCGRGIAHVGASDALDFGNGVERQIDRFVRLAHRFLVRSGHEAECLALLQIDVSGISADAKPRRRFLVRYGPRLSCAGTMVFEECS